MGQLFYDSNSSVTFEDRLLAHLEVVIISKLRRRESFAMSWREADGDGEGSNTIWLDPSLPVRFRFNGSRAPKLDSAWVERLALSASSANGLLVVDEDGAPAQGVTRERR
jgi:hypothetical protein